MSKIFIHRRRYLIEDAASGERQSVEAVGVTEEGRVEGYPDHDLVGEVLGIHTEFDRWNGERLAPALDLVRPAKWAEVKARRDELENGAAPTPFGPVQCDERSKQKVSGLVQMAQIAASMGEPFEESFTLADNSVVVLTVQSAIGLGVAVGRYISAVHAVARALRALIFAEDATVAGVLSIDVEASFDAALTSGEG